LDDEAPAMIRSVSSRAVLDQHGFGTRAKKNGLGKIAVAQMSQQISMMDVDRRKQDESKVRRQNGFGLMTS